MAWGSLPGTTLDGQSRALIQRGLGGIILFAHNVVDVWQLRALIAQIRTHAPGPIRIAIDQEGGHVVRVRAPLTEFPGAMALGAIGSAELARQVAYASGLELRWLGIDTVFAPDLDLAGAAWNPVLGARCFGSDPHLVAELGAAAVRGYLAAGIQPTGKHFPGHGRASVDSHIAAASVPGSAAELRRRDMLPFVAAVRAGVPILMSSHTVYDASGDRLPGTLSAWVMTHLARRHARFRGVLITDALVMRAIADGLPLGEAAVRSVEAGADVVMALGHLEQTVEALAAAIGSGRLPARRVASAVARALALPEAPPLPPLTTSDAMVPLPWSVEHARLARTVAHASLTLVSDARGLLPIHPTTRVVLVELDGTRSPVVDERGRTTLEAALRARFPKLRRIPAETIADSLSASDGVVVVVATSDAGPDEHVAALLALIAARGPLVHVALRDPGDLALAPPGAVTIAAYADVPATCLALADALLLGRVCFPGRLPVSIPAAVPQPRRDEVAA